MAKFWITLSTIGLLAAILDGKDIALLWFIPVSLLLFILLVTSVIKLVIFDAQAKFRYPFLDYEYSNKWKWFYYGNKYIQDISTRPYPSKKSDEQGTLE